MKTIVGPVAGQGSRVAQWRSCTQVTSQEMRTRRKEGNLRECSGGEGMSTALTKAGPQQSAGFTTTTYIHRNVTGQLRVGCIFLTKTLNAHQFEKTTVE